MADIDDAANLLDDLCLVHHPYCHMHIPLFIIILVVVRKNCTRVLRDKKDINKGFIEVQK